MKHLFVLILLSFSAHCYSQQKEEDYWHSTQLTGIIDMVGFIPKSVKIKDTLYFKARILAFTPGQLKQISRDANYLAAFKKGDLYQLYNMLYKKVDRNSWDVAADAFIALMCIDGTAKAE